MSISPSGSSNSVLSDSSSVASSSEELSFPFSSLFFTDFFLSLIIDKRKSQNNNFISG